MRATVTVLLSLLLTVGTSSLILAKGKTVKITISGADLKTPLEMTDPELLANFQVWTGPGTGSNAPGFNAKAPGLIVDWSRGPLEKIPQGLRKYQVLFHTDPHEQVVYVVYYAFNPSAEQGYVYVPGESDPWYGINVRSVARGPEVEGKWFPAWSAWEHVARPLIEKAAH